MANRHKGLRTVQQFSFLGWERSRGRSRSLKRLGEVCFQVCLCVATSSKFEVIWYAFVGCLCHEEGGWGRFSWMFKQHVHTLFKVCKAFMCKCVCVCTRGCGQDVRCKRCVWTGNVWKCFLWGSLGDAGGGTHGLLHALSSALDGCMDDPSVAACLWKVHTSKNANSSKYRCESVGRTHTDAIWLSYDNPEFLTKSIKDWDKLSIWWNCIDNIWQHLSSVWIPPTSCQLPSRWIPRPKTVFRVRLDRAAITSSKALMYVFLKAGHGVACRFRLKQGVDYTRLSPHTCCFLGILILPVVVLPPYWQHWVFHLIK